MNPSKRQLAENHFFPVIGFRVEDNIAVTENIFGTCSYLNNGLFITAGHSIKNASESPFIGISFKEGIGDPGKTLFPTIVHYVSDSELFEDFDLGILKLTETHTNAEALQWDTTPSIMLEDVQSIGFPYGFDAANKRDITRGLKGHIVCSTVFHRFPSAPYIYELSFHCPKGLSGAPLTTRTGVPPRVKGYIIGNEATEIMVFSEREVNEDSGEKTVYEKHETTKFGIAIQIGNLMKVHSRLLGATFEEYMEKEGLLWR